MAEADDLSLTGAELLAVLHQSGIRETDPRIAGAYTFLSERGNQPLLKDELSEVTKKETQRA